MKRTMLAVLLLGASACAKTTTPAGAPAPARSNEPGSASPRAAVTNFLDAINAQDVQATAMLWGTEKGPARDADVTREGLEQRIILMQCWFRNDKYQIVGDDRKDAKHHVFQVRLTKGPLTRTTTFATVEGPQHRWYVENGDIMPVKEFCRQTPGGANGSPDR